MPAQGGDQFFDDWDAAFGSDNDVPVLNLPKKTEKAVEKPEEPAKEPAQEPTKEPA